MSSNLFHLQNKQQSGSANVIEQILNGALENILQTPTPQETIDNQVEAHRPLLMSHTIEVSPADLAELKARVNRSGWSVHVHTRGGTRSWSHSDSPSKRCRLFRKRRNASALEMHVYELGYGRNPRTQCEYRIEYRNMPYKGAYLETPWAAGDYNEIARLGYDPWAKERIAEWTIGMGGIKGQTFTLEESSFWTRFWRRLCGSKAETAKCSQRNVDEQIIAHQPSPSIPDPAARLSSKTGLRLQSVAFSKSDTWFKEEFVWERPSLQGTYPKS